MVECIVSSNYSSRTTMYGLLKFNTVDHIHENPAPPPLQNFMCKEASEQMYEI